MEIDGNARPYDPRNPPPGPFWAKLELGLRLFGLMAAVYGLPIALLLFLFL